MKPAFTPLHYAIISHLLRYRLMTTAQLYRTVFCERDNPGTENNVANIMKSLHGKGFVSRDWLAVKPTERHMLARPSAIWYLKPENLKAVRAELEKKGKADLYESLRHYAPSLKDNSALAENTLRHELAITDFYSALERSISQKHQTLSLPLWLRTSPRHPEITRTVECEEKNQKNGTAKTIILPFNPDGFHMLHYPDKGHAFFFLEMDMNTETSHKKLHQKFLVYYHYSRQNRFAAEIAVPFGERYRLPLTRTDTIPFRVLVVAQHDKRRNDLLLKSISSQPLTSLFHFATLDDVIQNPFGEIWLSKKDFQNHLPEYQERAQKETLPLVREWAHSILSELPKHAL